MDNLRNNASLQPKVRRVVDYIGARFDSGEFQPGGRLPSERALAQDLNVSRNVVREAMMAMQIAGKVEVRSGEGTFVAPSPPNQLGGDALAISLDIADDLELRMSLEIASASLACLRARPSDLLRMRAALEAMSECADDGDYESFLDASMDLHVAIGAASHTRAVRDMQHQATEKTRGEEWLLAERYTPEIAAKSLKLHADMVDAIERRDIEAAVRASVAHYDNYPVIEANVVDSAD